MSDDFQSFLGELAVEGEKEGQTTSFTLSSDKAREKLQEFALQHPEHYFLLVLAGLHTLGAKNFRLRVDADDFEVEADCHIPRSALTALWTYVAGGVTSTQSTGLRLLALAILTSVRFQKALWSLSSSDAEGAYTFQQSIKDGTLPDSSIEASEAPVDGTKVAVKRKSLGQVASRFFTQLKNRVLQREWPEQVMLNQRMFLGVVESFELNGQALECESTKDPALAVMRQNSPPHFLKAKYSFTEGEEEAEPLTSLVVIVNPVDHVSTSPALGIPKKIFWIWHGLCMGYSDLGLPYDFCRVVYIADGMQTDLSFTAISDTWEKQHATRDAREAVRALLHGLALQYTERQICGEASHDCDLQAILLKVLANRIDTKKNPGRFARFNRDLIDCPLFLGSADDAVKRCFTLRDLWDRVKQGEKLACFTQPEEWEDVPVWPGRPVVIFGTFAHKFCLEKMFDVTVFTSARVLAHSLKELELLAQGGRSPSVPDPFEVAIEHIKGEFLWQGTTLSWILDTRAPVDQTDARQSGRIQVTRKGCLYFEDSWEELPQGMLLYGELDWRPHYSGGVAAQDKSLMLSHQATLALVYACSQREGSVTGQDVRVATQIWLELARPANRQLLEREELLSLPWLLVSEQGHELSRMSPVDYFLRVSKLDSPCFFLNPYSLEQEHQIETAFNLPPALVLPESVAKDLDFWFPSGLQSLRGCELLSARAPHEFSDEFLVEEMDESQVQQLDPRLTRVRMGVPKECAEVPNPGKLCLETNLRGAGMQVRIMNCFITPVTVCLDWSQGWPDSRGCHFADKTQAELGKLLLPRVVAWAAAEIFLHSDLSTLAELNGEFLNTAWLEFWSGDYGDHAALFPCAGGHRTSFSELSRAKHICYFCDLKRAAEHPPNTLWVPEELSESLDILGSEAEWTHADCWQAEPPPKVDVVETVEAPRDDKNEVVPSPSDAPSALPQAMPTEQKPTLAGTSEEPKAGSEPGSVTETEPTPEPKLKPDTEPEAETIVDSPLEPEPPSSLTSPTEPGPNTGLDPDIELLLGALDSLGPIPHKDDFLSFVSRVERDRDQVRALVLSEDTVILGGAGFFESYDESRLLLYLSSLYSVFNRILEEVEDSHEREFHTSLLARCDRLFGRSLGP